MHSCGLLQQWRRPQPPLLMRGPGRRGGFAIGSVFGLVGCAFCTLGLYIGEFWIFIAGTSAFGAFNSFNQYLRFAAAEAATDEYSARKQFRG